jgi:hypothetical protein
MLHAINALGSLEYRISCESGETPQFLAVQIGDYLLVILINENDFSLPKFPGCFGVEGRSSEKNKKADQKIKYLHPYPPLFDIPV